MTGKDWIMLGVLTVMSSFLWTWVWIEYQKPIVDPSWFSSEAYAQARGQVKGVAITTEPIINHPPSLE